MFSGNWLMERLLYLIPLVLSLTVHEWAHAYSAFRLGDDTAYRQGRLTLNPVPHIDPFGTILCPLLGVPFGWAKPVPVNPLRFRREVSMRGGMMITAAAGPLSNLALALICTVIWGVLARVGVVPPPRSFGADGGMTLLLRQAIAVNLALFVFNFIPVPPLDGSRIVDGVLPYRLRGAWELVHRYSGIALLLVIYLGSSIVSVPLGWLYRWIGSVVVLIAGT